MSKEDAEKYAIAEFDLMWCERYLVAYIELRTPPEPGATDHWQSLRSREYKIEHSFLDILARSLASMIVLSYSRPWSGNRNRGGKRARLPRSIFRDIAALRKRENPEEPLLPFNHDIHFRVLKLRDRVIAHSDASEWEFDIQKSEIETSEHLGDPFSYLTTDEARLLLQNTRSLRAKLNTYRREAVARV